MSRFNLLLALVLFAAGMTACSSQNIERTTASDDEAQVYRPKIGEIRN